MPGRCRRSPRYYNEWLANDNRPFTAQQLICVTIVKHTTFIEVIGDSPPPIQWYVPRDDISPWNPHDPMKDTILMKINTVIRPVFLDTSMHLDILFHDFMKGTVVAVSDGSNFADMHCAAAAWIFESECRTQWIIGSVIIPGATTDFNAYRSELTGYMAPPLAKRP